MIRTITALLLVTTIAPIAEAQCPGGRCQTRGSTYYFTYPSVNPVVAAQDVAYQIADASGKLWQHADAAYLVSWVAGHNKTLVVPTPQVVPVVPEVTPADQNDQYGFGAMLNRQRYLHYRGAIVHDPALSALAAANSSKGWGHHGGHHGRENVGMGSLDSVMASWLASPAHASALLDPSLSRYGIAQVNGIWTYVGAR